MKKPAKVVKPRKGRCIPPILIVHGILTILVTPGRKSSTIKAAEDAAQAASAKMTPYVPPLFLLTH
jgi:fermentation-respiration switch protein FrsA (DUF1100 family)